MTLRIFLVEDNAVIRENLAATLEELVPAKVVGFAVDEQSAKAWVMSNPLECDLLIIDVFLVAGSGLGVLQATRTATAARVVISNYATSDMRGRCRELGASRVFDKSNEIEALVEYCRYLGTAAPRH